ncbi:MAG: hypothetical protein ACSHX7_12675, partial [Luteolibacter sp.]
ILFGEADLTNVSPPKIVSTSIKNWRDTFALRFTGELGRQYRLQYTDDLSDSDSWLMLDEDIELKLSPKLLEQPTAGSKRFWRVVLEQ